MDVTVVVQATLHTEFLIDRRQVVATMAAEARRLGLEATWDWTVYRLPAWRRLLDHAGIGNSVSFALRAGGRTHGRQAVHRDAASLARFLEGLRDLNVFDGIAVLACAAVSEPPCPDAGDRPPEPRLLRCDVFELASQLEEALRAAETTGHFPETLWFVALPQRTTRAFERGT